MFLLNYNDPQWSRKINCKALNDCSGRTVTDNGSQGLVHLSNGNLSKKKAVDLFHIGFEITATMGLVSLKNKKFTKPTLIGTGILALAYYIGRNNQI